MQIQGRHFAWLEGHHILGFPLFRKAIAHPFVHSVAYNNMTANNNMWWPLGMQFSSPQQKISANICNFAIGIGPSWSAYKKLSMSVWTLNLSVWFWSLWKIYSSYSQWKGNLGLKLETRRSCSIVPKPTFQHGSIVIHTLSRNTEENKLSIYVKLYVLFIYIQ